MPARFRADSSDVAFVDIDSDAQRSGVPHDHERVGAAGRVVFALAKTQLQDLASQRCFECQAIERRLCLIAPGDGCRKLCACDQDVFVS